MREHVTKLLCILSILFCGKINFVSSTADRRSAEGRELLAYDTCNDVRMIKIDDFELSTTAQIQQSMQWPEAGTYNFSHDDWGQPGAGHRAPGGSCPSPCHPTGAAHGAAKPCVGKRSAWHHWSIAPLPADSVSSVAGLRIRVQKIALAACWLWTPRCRLARVHGSIFVGRSAGSVPVAGTQCIASTTRLYRCVANIDRLSGRRRRRLVVYTGASASVCETRRALVRPRGSRSLRQLFWWRPRQRTVRTARTATPIDWGRRTFARFSIRCERRHHILPICAESAAKSELTNWTLYTNRPSVNIAKTGLNFGQQSRVGILIEQLSIVGHELGHSVGSRTPRWGRPGRHSGRDTRSAAATSAGNSRWRPGRRGSQAKPAERRWCLRRPELAGLRWGTSKTLDAGKPRPFRRRAVRVLAVAGAGAVGPTTVGTRRRRPTARHFRVAGVPSTARRRRSADVGRKTRPGGVVEGFRPGWPAQLGRCNAENSVDNDDANATKSGRAVTSAAVTRRRSKLRSLPISAADIRLLDGPGASTQCGSCAADTGSTFGRDSGRSGCYGLEKSRVFSSLLAIVSTQHVETSYVML